MTENTINIKPFNLKAASDTEYAAMSAFRNQMRAERLPDDPPTPLEHHISRAQSMPPFIDVSAWAAWKGDDSAIVAFGVTQIFRTDENQHIAGTDLEVLPEFRRQGIARRLLARTVDIAQRENRRLMIGQTSGRIAAGEAFANRLGAGKGLESHVNQLDLADLNRDLISSWQQRATERAAGFELGLWTGRYPEERIEDIVAIFEVVSNDQPRGDLDIEDFRYTPEQIRHMEERTLANGAERWSMYMREVSTDALAGITEVIWKPSNPQILDQQATVVFPQYRGKGLGRWLKAAMLKKVLKERPQVKFIRTENVDTNEAMLNINNELGFKPYLSECLWQIETEKVAAYLEKVAV